MFEMRCSTAACLVALMGLVGCRGATRSSSVADAAPTRVDAASSVDSLLALIDEIAQSCQVSRHGLVRRDTCHVSGLVEAARQDERAMNSRQLLRGYCRHLSRASVEGRAMLGRRLARFGRDPGLRAVADEQIYRCLTTELKGARQEPISQNLARAVALFGAALGHHEDVARQLSSLPNPRARQAGYQSLWTGGRLRALPQLERLVEHGSLRERVAVVRGFAKGPNLTSDEERTVCPLLTGLLAAPQLDLVESAASAAARVCPDARPRVIEAGERLLAAGHLRASYVRALSSAAGFFENKAGQQQLRRIVGLLQRATAAQNLDASARAASLLTLRRLDSTAALRLARRYRASGEPRLRRTAEQIVHSAKRPGRPAAAPSVAR